MKVRILAIPSMSPTKRDGIVLESINGLGFKERTTYVLQAHRWEATDKGFEEVWEDVPIINERDLGDGSKRGLDGGTS
jgi:hypothetical protein